MTQRALGAADVFDRQGSRTAVLHVPTIKPFVTAAVAGFAASVERLAVQKTKWYEASSPSRHGMLCRHG